MRKLLVVALLLLLTSCVHYGPYDKHEKYLFGALAVTSAADVAISHKGISDGYREMNLIAGDKPNLATLIGIKVAVGGALYYILPYFPHEIRKPILYTVNIGTGVAVVHNIGVVYE